MTKPYKPPSGRTTDLLNSITSLLGHPNTKTINESFGGKRHLCVFPGGQLYFESNLELDTDGSPYHKQDGTGQGRTSTRDAAGKFVDADKINFFVLPKGGFDSRFHIGIGDVAVVIYGGWLTYACFADRGPPDKLGEGSISLHRALGHETIVGGKLVNVGIGPGIVTIVFPGSAKGKYAMSNAESAAVGEPLFLKLRGEGYAYEMALLARFRSRQMVIPFDQDALEGKLLDWVQEIVDNTPHPPSINGIRPASYLMATAEGVSTLLYAPTPMAIPNSGSRPERTVYARFALGTMPNGRWFVRHIVFHLGPADQAAAEQAEKDAKKAELKEELEEKARMRRQ